MKEAFSNLIETSTADELEEFIQQAGKLINKKRKSEARALKAQQQKEEREKIAQLKKMAKELGVSVKIRSKSTTQSEVVYRHPDDDSLTWTGRGRKPLWVNDWEQQGGSLDDLSV